MQQVERPVHDQMKRILAVAAWSAVGFIVYATLVPLPMRPHLGDHPNYERFAAYAAAGVFLALAYPHRVFRVALVTVAIAIGLECLQAYAIDRHPGLLDVAVKAAGALAGVLLAQTGSWLVRYRRGLVPE